MKTLKIYGPPGTGKTHTMLEYFTKELERVKSERIAFLTFTRAARLEALERTHMPEEALPYVKTIHAICYRLLNMSRGRMMTTYQVREFGRKIGMEIKGTMHDPWSLESLTGGNSQPSIGDRLLQLNHLGRHRRYTLKQMLYDAPTDIDWPTAKWFTESYRAWKKAEGLLDYTDLLTEYLAKGPPLSADVMFIDEGQDLSRLQWEVAAKLGLYVHRRYLCGDDDQTIYQWAGASSELFNAEPANEIKVLPRSFRIPQAVQKISHEIITRVAHRYPKEFTPRESPGEYRPIGGLEFRDLGYVGRTFILYRNHFRGATLATLLEELAWPFAGMYSPIDQSQVRLALKGWEAFQDGKMLDAECAIAVAVHASSQYLAPGATTIKPSQPPVEPARVLRESAKGATITAVLNKLPKSEYIANVIRTAGLKALLNPTVTLMSIHQSKGREAETVILDLEMTRRTYEHYLQCPDEEHRVFYVGATRARERLLTLMPTQGSSYLL